ncbi:MAG: ATP-dependent zinc metalloprotease FtsH [Anaerolineales bacterium]|nr:ATP-dependent zinc metalloprotease FtsH [Anaerolineales bacterium]
MDSSRLRNGFVYLLILVAIIAILFSYRSQKPATEELAISDLAAEVKLGNVDEILVDDDGQKLMITFTDASEALSQKEPTTTLEEILAVYGVEPAQLESVRIQIEKTSDWTNIVAMLSWILPALLFAGIFFFMIRQAQGSNNQAISFGKSRARMFTGDQPKITFDDVAGLVEAKEELQEVVEFLKEPEKFISLGARIPKGVLLVGPPGTGKTLMAKAVSGEAGVPFFSISGSEFVEMFVGVGASRVRDLFDQAKRHSPCIVFVDEVDAVGRHRGAGLGGSHDEREQTLNQILVEMDGFDTDTNVIVIAATNRPDILDPALLRPGRFDRRVVLDRPDLRGREAIFGVHVRGKPLAADVDLTELARNTPGFVGADIENTINEAAILAARKEKKSIGMEEVQEAIERVVAGPQRKSRLLSPIEKETVAYHEAGHAVTAHMLPNCDPVSKVTIIPRGMGLGYTMAMPEEDRYLQHKAKFKDDLSYALGGRAAEELTFGDITTGASNDLERVTKLARDMVTRYGMSEKLGPMVYGQKDELVFLGREISEQRDYSDSVAEEIDSEVRRIVNDAYEKAKSVLSQHKDKLEAVARRLIEVETINANEFEALMSNGKPPTPVSPPEQAKTSTKQSDKLEPDISIPTLDFPPSPAPA